MAVHEVIRRLENMLFRNGVGVTRLAVFFSVASVVGTFGIGYQAYEASRTAILNNIYGSNLVLAHAFRDFAASESERTPDVNVLGGIRTLWNGLNRSSEGAYLCIVDTDGMLTLHTAAPDREGANVGGNLVHPDNPISLSTLINRKGDYVGPYISSSGQRQIAAFSYVPSLKSSVAIHIPYETIQTQIHETSLPWLVGLIFIGAVLVPFAIWFLHYAYQMAQGKLRKTNRQLNAEIGERRKAEQELWLHRHRLEELVAERTTALTLANEELESFSYSVSHDLRTPLRSIDGFSQALLEDCEDKLDDEAKSYLQRVRNGVEHMGALIDDLLELSRVARSSLAHQTVDLSALAQATVAQIRESEPQRELDLKIAEDLKADADPNLIAVVLENLLGNAWKYTGKRERAMIEFGQLEQQQDGETVYYVRDNGVGFDMQFADRLFGAFQRLHSRDEFAGTGVGLATVRRIVQRHGGRVWAEAEVDKGSTFYFTLPVSTVKQAPNALVANLSDARS